jgi:cytochrome c553
MTGRKSNRALASLVGVAGALLLSRTADPIEIDPASGQGRTEAAIAEFRAAVMLEPDLKHGAELFETCAACHGADGQGVADGSVPAIARQHVSVIVKQLVDFRHDRRWDKRMRYFARNHGLAGPQDLLDVAAYAESLPRGTRLQEGPGDDAKLQQGFIVYHRDCASCHGPLALGDLRSIRPRLAGQHYLYLVKQLEETAAGARPGMDEEHVRLIGRLSSAERSGVADYLSRLTPDLTSKKVSAP